MEAFYHSSKPTEEELAAWTVTEKQSSGGLCECIDVYLSEKMITPKGRSKPTLACSFVMKLVEVVTGEEITCYFNFEKSKAGHAKVKHNGKFAKLYRLTFGTDPRKRYSQAKSLANHFIGEPFLVKYEIVKTEQNDSYRKAICIKPVEPVVTEQWTNTGKLRTNTRRRNNPRNLGKVFDEPLKSLGNIVEKSLTDKAVNPHSYLASPVISNTSKSQHASKQERLKAVTSMVTNDLDNKPIAMTLSSETTKQYIEYF